MRICAFGDSFVNGTGDPDRLGWLGRATAGLRAATIYNLGVRGDTSSGVRVRWRDEAGRRLPPAPDGRILFSFGVNDCCWDADVAGPRVPPERAVQNAEAILAASAACWPTLMIGPLPIADAAVNRRVAALNGAYAAAARRAAVPFCDVFAAMAADATWMAEVAAWDGAHPGAAGYRALAAVIAGSPAWRAWFAPPPAGD